MIQLLSLELVNRTIAWLCYDEIETMLVLNYKLSGTRKLTTYLMLRPACDFLDTGHCSERNLRDSITLEFGMVT